jgi:hypothetical protein
MQTLLRMPRAPLTFSLMAVFGVIVFGLAVGVLMQPAVQIVGMERTSELVCLQLAFTPERAAAVVLAFPEEARIGIAQLLVPGDLALAWGYGFLLAGLMGLLAMRLTDGWFRVGAIAMWIPLVASTFDCIENAFLYAIVVPLAENPDAIIAAILPLMAGIVSTIKWIALCVVTPAFGFSGIVKGMTIDRSWSALVIYFLLFLVLLSMVMKPVQDIPACF